MLQPARYAALSAAAAEKGMRFIVGDEAYQRCHHLPGWYAQCSGLTPETIFLSKEDDLALALSQTGWRANFVKDYVKPLTTMRGSIARNVDEVREVIDLIERYRGCIEGGICIRELEDLWPDTEERYFVLQGREFCREGAVPAIVHDIARRIDSPFFSVDIVLDTNGNPRLIELGDGQVSDRKKWPAEAFVHMLKESAGHLCKPSRTLYGPGRSVV